MCVGGGGGGGGGRGGEREGEEGDSYRKKGKHKNNRYSLIFCAHALYKFPVPGSSGSLVLTQTKGVTDR